jgi:serine phosphatase RsbU (regulator of sigma subunit)
MKKAIILCVDDEKVVLTSLKAQLKRHFGNDYIIETSDNGNEAFDFIIETIERGYELPVIVSDHIMPGMKGDELLINVHSKLPRTLTIMLTGQADAEAVGNALNRANLYRYISKPWDETDLKMTITEALRRFYQDKKIEEQNIELEKMLVQLKQYNETLEEKVKERTALINEQKEEIISQRDLLARQNLNITDSIEYARLIQCALLPSDKALIENLPEHFLLFKPRDIVSGDFYWIKKNGNDVYLAVADCTGHGVPGAFMGTLGISLLNEFMNTSEIFSPEFILAALRERLKESLHQENTQDGMDMALVMINPDSGKMKFAGANLPVFLVRNGELIEYSGNRMPIGLYPRNEQFICHDIQLKKNDTLYFFSDGYLSQFGGDKSMKFSTKRFRNLILDISNLPLHEQKTMLEKSLYDWQGRNEQVDDILIIGFRVN